MSEIRIIQGGMGVGVSGWRLARAVAKTGQQGVVSGTALSVILARRLQLGDPEGHLRRALARFPVSGIADRVLARYYIAGDGKACDEPFRPMPFPTARLSQPLLELTVLANFAEVYLAREGLWGSGRIGVNYLEKTQSLTLASIYGAMLAGVDDVLMGAGVPRAIPGALDRLAQGQVAELRLDVSGLPQGQEVLSRFDPQAFWGALPAPRLQRPRFLAIVSSATLATALARKANGRVDGFVVEGSSAGGHNAPPRGTTRLDDKGEPLYGPADVPDLERIKALGLPYWLAGSYATPGKLREAERLGAAGVQVGTLFAFCAESGITEGIRRRVIDAASRGSIHVFTDPSASPTGFPFKVLQLAGTLSDAEVYEQRQRDCSLGHLRTTYYRSDGSLGYRCAAEPIDHYVRKGGTRDQAAGRKCLCNGLLATVGLGQPLGTGRGEPPLLTAGEEVAQVGQLARARGRDFTAADVVRYLLSEENSPEETPLVDRRG